jgi:hypothetical protein
VSPKPPKVVCPACETPIIVVRGAIGSHLRESGAGRVRCPGSLVPVVRS